MKLSMTSKSRIRGIGKMEWLLAVLVVIIALAILLPISLRNKRGNLLLDESGRMRKVYISLSLYEEQYDTLPAPNLLAAATYDPVHEDFLSGLDPYAHTQATSFPSDPGLEKSAPSPFRISFSYIQNFLQEGKLKVKPWAVARTDPTLGVLGNEWYGSVTPTDNFQAQVSGRLMRINTDGSVYVLEDRGGPKSLGDAQDLFIKR